MPCVFFSVAADYLSAAVLLIAFFTVSSYAEWDYHGKTNLYF